jgi:hypothetical protein
MNERYEIKYLYPIKFLPVLLLEGSRCNPTANTKAPMER